MKQFLHGGPNRVTLLRIGLLFVLVFLIYNEFIWARLFAGLSNHYCDCHGLAGRFI